MIKIKRNTNGDTRVATKIPTYGELKRANESHIEDVNNVMLFMSEQIQLAGLNHDFTKRTHSGVFYDDFCDTLEGKADFTELEWSKLHYATERHHLNRRCPDDVNIIDVIEMIADCTCAAAARSGTEPTINIDSEILQKALQNTIKLISDKIEIVE